MNSLKFNLLIIPIMLIAISCKISFSAENITIETKSDNLFENIVSDTLLFLDPDLKEIIANDFSHVVTNSKFHLQVNSWKPRPNPKIKLVSIYNNINSNNIRESFASLVQPVIEIACTPQRYDPLNEISSKCIKELFKYPIIEIIQIGYTYKPNMTIEQSIANLSNLNDQFRYHQIIWTIADIMNGAYERVSKKQVTKSINFVKYPLALISAPVVAEKTPPASDKTRIINEKADLESLLDKKRIQCTDAKLTKYEIRDCDKTKSELRDLIEELESNPSFYFSNKQVRALQAKANMQARAQEQEGKKHRVNHGAINPVTGEFLAPAGAGYVGTRDGTYYTPTGSHGVINTRTGEFSPLTR